MSIRVGEFVDNNKCIYGSSSYQLKIKCPVAIPVVTLIQQIKQRLLYTRGQDISRWEGQVNLKVTGVIKVKVTVLTEYCDSVESQRLVLSKLTR